MKLTQKLLGWLHRVFDPNPEPFSALRIWYSGTSMNWVVADGVLTISVSGGPGSGLTIDLSQYSIATLVDYIAAQPGYTVPYADGTSRRDLSALVLLDGSGDQFESNGDLLQGYESLLYVMLEPAAAELQAAQAQIVNAIAQMDINSAEANWLDFWGDYFNVPRTSGELDPAYAPRMIATVLRRRGNNVAMEAAIGGAIGQPVTVTNVTEWGPTTPLFNNTISFDGTHTFNASAIPIYGLFDVDYAYDLLAGQDLLQFAAYVRTLVETMRDGGTQMRSLNLQASQLSDTLTAPTDGASLLALALTMPLTDTFTAPTDTLSVLRVVLAGFFDTLTAPTDAVAFTDWMNTRFNSVRTYDGAVPYAGFFDPSLFIDFQSENSLDSRLSFSRSTSAYRVNESGILEMVGVDVPRLDYDPVSLASKGLLIEESRYNQAVFSESFGNGHGVAVQPNAIKAPNGLFTADLVTEDNSPTTRHYTSDIWFAPVVGNTYVWSTFVKDYSGNRLLYMRIAAGNVGAVTFDPVAGVFTTPTSNGVISDAGSQQFADGWYRVWVIWTATSASTTVCRTQLVNPAAGAGYSLYSGDGVSGLYLWGRSLEGGAFPTSYFPSADSFGSRASSATYFDSNGVMQIAPADTARYGYKYDGSAWVSEGLMKETPSSNLIEMASNVDSSYWTGGAVKRLKPTVAPDGSIVPFYWEDNSSSANLFRSNGLAITNAVYVASVFVKWVSGTSSLVSFQGAGWSVGVRLNWDASGGLLSTVSNGGVGSINVGSYPVGGGWYRVWCSVLASTSTATGANLYLWPSDFTGSGVGLGAIYAWGAQVELGFYPTSFIPSVDSFTSRASTATYFDSTGTPQLAAANVGRYGYSYDGAKWAPLGLLNEATSSNLIPNSTNLSLGGRTNTNYAEVAAPWGILSGWLIYENSSTSSHYFDQNGPGSFVNGDYYCFWAIVEPAGRTQVALINYYAIGSGGGSLAKFDLSTGTVISSAAYDAGVIPLGNGRFLCWRTDAVAYASTYTNILNRIVLLNQGVVSYAGDGESGVIVWASQLEKGTLPTSYIPTSGGSASRSADVVSSVGGSRSGDAISSATGYRAQEVTQFNDLSWYSGSDISMFADAQFSYSPQVSGTRGGLFRLDDGATGNNMIFIFRQSGGTSILGGVWSGAVNNGSANTASVGTSEFKSAFSVGVGYPVAISANGSTPSDASTPVSSLPSISRALIGIGHPNGVAWQTNGWIRRVAAWNRRIPDVQLQQLTT